MSTPFRRPVILALAITAVIVVIVAAIAIVKRRIDEATAITLHRPRSTMTLRAIYDRFMVFKAAAGHYPRSDEELEMARRLARTYWAPLDHEVEVIVLYECLAAGHAGLLAVALAHPHTARRFPGIGKDGEFHDARLGVWADGSIRPLSLADLEPLKDCLPEGIGLSAADGVGRAKPPSP